MRKILVANRGEISLRIQRTARKLGYKTVAIFSEADRDAPHVLYADEAICVGPPPSSESYLRGDYIIEKALEVGASAIHPGYGFLSENAEFAKKVETAGIVFIGPGQKAITIMGSKLAAKDAVKDYDIPMVPGHNKAISSSDEAIKIAEKIGYPILIKASAGGGGKGMRVVQKSEDLKEQMERAVSEAEASFGDGDVFVEKYITGPRHIEIQVLADSHGNYIHLFERECSIQRRHQKVVEEAPSAVLTEDLRKAMGAAALDVAKSCDYLGAGTVEFLLDENKNFYFLEMNTRLQVEHPVSEMITGVDLVEEQINIAFGQPISFKQEDLKITGHAIELRVYAEDPLNNFLPSIGNLSVYKKPEGEGIRIDDGFRAKMDIPIYYDPMIAKLICFASTRSEAIQKMKNAIEKFEIEGIKTTLGFGTFVMNHAAFISGDFDTKFVEKYFSPSVLEEKDKKLEEIAAIAANYLFQKDQKILTTYSS